MRVGAIRRFFGCCVASGASGALPSPFSGSVVAGVSRFPRTVPENELVVLGRGVWGGVVRGRVDGGAELVAVTDGTAPRVGVGLLTTAANCGAGVCVAIEPAELDRAGLAGGT